MLLRIRKTTKSILPYLPEKERKWLRKMAVQIEMCSSMNNFFLIMRIERIITATMFLFGFEAVVIGVYVSTDDSPQQVQNNFYWDSSISSICVIQLRENTFMAYIRRTLEDVQLPHINMSVTHQPNNGGKYCFLEDAALA